MTSAPQPSSAAAVRPSPPGAAAWRPGAHLPALDGIRGLAILLVIVHHVAHSFHAEFDVGGLAIQALKTGWVGVDLFFVLSGFLITGILFDAKGSAGYFRNFYARRALRVFPLYYAALALAFAVDAAWPGHERITGTGEHSYGLWLYLTNLFLAQGGWETYGWLGHFWSLAIEEHFYLAWPFLVFWGSRRALLRISAAIVVGALLLRLAAFAAGVWPGAIYFLTPFRADALALGAFLALLARGDRPITTYAGPARVVGALAAAGVAVVAVGLRRFDYDFWPVYTAGFSLLALLFGSVVLLTVAAHPASLLSRTLASQVPRFFGKYSYGLYVVHTPIFTAFLHTEAGRALLKGMGLWSPVAAGLVVVTASLAVALLSWHLLEKPCLSLKRFFEYQPGAKPRQKSAILNNFDAQTASSRSNP